MNILFVCSAKAWGGNEKWTAMAMKALSKHHRLFFVGKSSKLLTKFDPQEKAVTLPFRSYFDWYTFNALKRFIAQNQIDVVVSTKKKEYFMCGIIARQLGIKHIIRLGVSRKMNIPIWHKLNYRTLNDGLIVNAGYLKEELNKNPLFNQHPIHAIYNGIPGFYSDSPLPEKQQHAKFIIVSSGRITRQKGYGLLIEAINLLDDELKQQVEVRIIGEGRNKEEFEQQSTSLQLDNKIRFYGFVDTPTLLMKDADMFILLSEREGISNSILEAMTLGIPVLSTDTGGIKEVIKDNQTGFLTERSPVAIAQKLTELIRNQQPIRAVGENAFDLIKAKFAYDVFEQNINELFCRL
ncbi:glycosyltransferase family 4 protein [Carboxylicivirga sediminis]|uniref:Glycosyltransferase family 4 protein n=1 Tax=Carboxylicivirga sediminis TaxID=2006564 RepID=A0A941F7L2_9BACT|nr:glycosyltransferase family 4 protein [Carboxylicivirga sediminis]MBR8537902.1 glycosyltransferase family 4 protein [Carboxylicivirga sediminis]